MLFPLVAFVQQMDAAQVEQMAVNAAAQTKADADREKILYLQNALTENRYAATAPYQTDKDEKLVPHRFVMSTKLEQLVTILHRTSDEDAEAKTVVFSQFTSMLDLVELVLHNENMSYLRYDGKMNTADRSEALNDFATNDAVKILLVSLKAGGVGLNLTVASRVVMLDCWWNPMCENQAIDRVHRIGQRKPVKVHRLTIDNTVEDRILLLQQEKEKLAAGALGEGEGQNARRLTLRDLMFLFNAGGRNVTPADQEAQLQAQGAAHQPQML